MLLTFPTKESLLRQIQESPLEQTHLIIADYRKLANWNLIPLNNLTVLLGPNSAGKSSVSEALDVLNILRDGIRTNNKDERIDNLYSAKRDDGETSIGFSAQFPDITFELKKLTETCLMELNRDWENPDNYFPALTKYFNDRAFKDHLEQTTYTYCRRCK
jgi:predicted ATP-binding protein involved in virulence